MFNVVCSYVGECTSLAYSFLLLYLVRYIRDEAAELKMGLIYLSAFGALVFISSFLRNYYIFNGLVFGVRMRKAVVGSLFNKVSKMSVKSLARTNSGTLVALASADVMQIERPISLISMAISGSFINITCYIGIGVIFEDWGYVLIILGVWLFMVVLQLMTTQKQRVL
jgi:ABC-type multidrug transport system fused ATPase/permease subunit